MEECVFSQFASAEGKTDGEVYTPRCVVRLLVEMPEPYRERACDPCRESSGIFVQFVEFIHAPANGNSNVGRARGDNSANGQDISYTM